MDVSIISCGCKYYTVWMCIVFHSDVSFPSKASITKEDKGFPPSNPGMNCKCTVLVPIYEAAIDDGGNGYPAMNKMNKHLIY